MLAVILACAGCASAKDPGIMTWGEYKTRSVQWPYILHIRHGQGELLYFGARHTYKPSDPLVAQIERLWTCFRPTMAFSEGGNPPTEASRDKAVENAGEAGLVRFLAARDDVPVTTLDPSRSEEVAHLRRTFSARDVKMYFVSRAAAQFGNRKGVEGVDTEIERVLAIFNANSGLSGPPRSLSEVASAYDELFPEGGSYRTVPLAWFDPVASDGLFSRMSRASSEYRNRAIVGLLTRHVADGQRVFAVVGGSHVVMQEAALRAAVGVQDSIGRDPSPECP